MASPEGWPHFLSREMPPPEGWPHFLSREMPPPEGWPHFLSREMPPPEGWPHFLSREMPSPEGWPHFLSREMPPPEGWIHFLSREMPHSAAAATNIERFGCPHTRPGSPDHSSLRDVWRVNAIHPYMYPANLAGIPDAPGQTSLPPPPPALECVNRGLTFAPVKKGAEDGVMHDYFSLLLTTLNYII